MKVEFLSTVIAQGATPQKKEVKQHFSTETCPSGFTKFTFALSNSIIPGWKIEV